MKDIFFLSGLPRSGNTLLSALLNQNPKIYVSPLSPLLDNLSWIDKALNTNESTLCADFQPNTASALKQFVDGFYNDIDKPVIIDRNKGWGSKESMFISYKYITNKPKIIFTVRDIPSVLASFLALVGEGQDNFIDNKIREFGIKPYGEQTQNDLRCDYLMNGQVGVSLVTLTELLQIGTSLCLIEYDDLIYDPQGELNKIYDFLEIDQYFHNFDNVVKLENETLENVNLPINLHDVRSKVEKTALDPKLVLPLHSQNKYAGLEFWRQ